MPGVFPSRTTPPQTPTAAKTHKRATKCTMGTDGYDGLSGMEQLPLALAPSGTEKARASKDFRHRKPRHNRLCFEGIHAEP
jgi:hypothetical protein